MANPKPYFNQRNCKGCSLCVAACPKKLIKLGQEHNELGYHPAGLENKEQCTGCGLCAVMCPDIAIILKQEVA